MPNRMIRESLLESDAWLSLNDNACRVCWLVLVLRADDVGNLEASTPRLMRLWRDYGVDSEAEVLRVLSVLNDSDLIRTYEVIHKRYIHLPRYAQRLRFVKRRWPASPWDDNEKIQKVAQKKTDQSQSIDGLESARSEVEVKRSRREVEVEVKYDNPTNVGQVGELARKLGLTPHAGESLEEFKTRLYNFQFKDLTAKPKH